VAELRSGAPRIGAVCRSCAELLEAARAGKAMGLVGESVARAQSWPQLAFVEVRDIPRATLAIAWRSDSLEPTVRNFVTQATDLSIPRPAGPRAQAATA